MIYAIPVAALIIFAGMMMALAVSAHQLQQQSNSSEGVVKDAGAVDYRKYLIVGASVGLLISCIFTI